MVTNIHSLEDASLDFEKRSGIMFIGGFMHTPNEDAMLWFVEEIWPIIKTKIENPHSILSEVILLTESRLLRPRILRSQGLWKMWPHFLLKQGFLSVH